MNPQGNFPNVPPQYTPPSPAKKGFSPWLAIVIVVAIVFGSCILCTLIGGLSEVLKPKTETNTMSQANLASPTVSPVASATALPAARKQNTPVPSSPADEKRAVADDELAKRELKKFDWVKDVYVSPGYMNVGVIRNEKRWDSPMIGNAVCGILRRTGSNLTYVRYVDIEEVTYQQKSPTQAEIYSMQCK